MKTIANAWYDKRMVAEKHETPQIPQTTQTVQPTPTVWTVPAILGFGLMTLIWGSFPIAVKLGVNGVPPFLLAGARFSLAGVLLFALLLMRRERPLLPRQRLPGVALLAFLIIVVPGASFFWAVQYAPVGTLSTIWATSPIFTALVNIRARDEARGWRLALSMVIGLLGVALVFIDKLGVGEGQALIAEGVVLCSAVFYGLGMRVVKSTADLPLLPLTAWELLLGGLMLSTASLLFERGQPVLWTATNVGSLLYLAIIAACITYLLTFWLIKQIGAIRTTYNSFLVPGIALVLANLLLGEPITLPKLAGMALVVGGLALLVRS
ncbi:MAG TPA: EamA family transporter [Ktedonobacterales bacterium]|nr:EamA family transporter [Ktedonobacterales bacterium]